MKNSKRKIRKPGELYNKHKKHHKLPVQSTNGYRYSVNRGDPLSETYQSASTHPFNPLYAGKSEYEDPKGSTILSKKRSGKGKSKKHNKLRKVDNKMRSFGDFNEDTGKIRINKKMSAKSRKEKGNYPELLDTIVHEEYHKKNPKASERKTRKVTKRVVKKMGRKAKSKFYARYN